MPWNNVCVPISQLGEDEQIGLALESTSKPTQPTTAPAVAPVSQVASQPTAPSTHKSLVYYIIIGVLALVIIG